MFTPHFFSRGLGRFAGFDSLGSAFGTPNDDNGVLMPRLISALFNILLIPLYPALALYTLHRRFVQQKSSASLAGQWGFVPSQVREKADGPKIWLHAVSVGEMMVARPIALALKNEIPGCRIALSATTDTGFQAAQSLQKSGVVDSTFYFPLDLPPITGRVLNQVCPDAILFIETEMWPNLLHAAHRRGIKTFLINGRVSDNLLIAAPRLGPLWKWMTGNMDGFLMRSAFDANRLKQIGAPERKIFVAGDVKLEAPPVESSREAWREQLGFEAKSLVWIAGSTHPGEEEICLRVHQKLREKWPDLGLILAPRHVERAGEVATLIQNADFSLARRSQHRKSGQNSVFLLDTVGELGEVYAAADVAFVGGSLIERGGHNLLEPVLRGAPVVFGPSVMNFRTAAQLVIENKLGDQVANEKALFAALDCWLDDEKARRALPARVEAALAAHRGAAQKTARHIAAALAVNRA